MHEHPKNEGEIHGDRARSADQLQRKFDRFARMHLSRYQRQDDRLLHLVAGSDRFLARMALTMFANPNGSAMRSLAICGLRAQSESRALPGCQGASA